MRAALAPCGSPAALRTPAGLSSRRPQVPRPGHPGRSTAVRVAGRYAPGGSGNAPPPPRPAPPPQQFQAPPQPGYSRAAPQGQQQRQSYQQPPPQQPAVQRQPAAGSPRGAVPPRRRIGVAQAAQAPSPSRLAQLSAAVAPSSRAAYEEPIRTRVQRRAGAAAGETVLLRSLLMDKEIITRTSGNRLGYVNELWVDPSSLAVAALYLRAGATSLAAPSTAHVLLPSLRQISDVILVHDDNVLLDPPADDTVGCCRLVGALVVTQSGQELGRVRDYAFDPDNGAISTIKYDRLGIPALPQALFSCYSISWEDVVALGPTKLIVRTGTEQRAIKENDGIADAGVALLVDVILGPPAAGDPQAGGAGLAGGAPAAAAGTPEQNYRWRSSPEYRAWYAEHGQNYEQYYGNRMPPPLDAPAPPRQAEAAAPPPPPRALPPPRNTPFAQAVQARQPQQGGAARPTYQQQLRQQQRQAVPAGGGGWGTPQPPAAAQQQQQAYASPPQQPAPRGAQYSQQPPRGPPPLQQQQQAPRAAQQQPLPPQNGIPIIDRTPPPPYRRRDADGNYGSAPSQPAAASRPPATQRTIEQTAAQTARPQPPTTPVVEPDAVIPGSGSQAQPRGGAGGALPGSQVAEYRQL